MRAEALVEVPGILRHLLEDDEDDFDMKDPDVTDLTPVDEWQQVDGDYGDPWLYGGAWYNPSRKVIWYFEGTENTKEIDQDQIPIPASMTAALDQRYPLDYVDPDGDEEWQARERQQNEYKRDELIGSYRYARAAYLEMRKPRTFYEIDADPEDELSPWLERYVQSAADALGHTVQEFREMPLYAQLLEIGRYIGFDEIGHSFMMTQIEARQALGEPKL